MSTDEEEVWYRFEDFRTAYWNPWDEDAHGPSSCAIRLMEFKVVKTTPKGVWLSRKSGLDDFTDSYKRFVRRDAVKRYACPTIQEAKESFIARKERQVGILSAQKKHAKQAIVLIQRKYPLKGPKKQTGPFKDPIGFDQIL